MSIRRVVLYKHGVGYFEREAEIEGNSELRLSFREAEMNDVLKSLTVEDLDGGSIQSVSYDTQQPVAKLLEEAALDLPESGGASALLSRLRGASVRARISTRSTEGQIVGLEEVKRHTDHGLVQSFRLTLLDRNGSLYNLDLQEITELTFLDETVRRELAFFYDTLVQGFKPGAKSLRIFGRGEGKRRISISFVVESPVWKTSYRFLLPPADSDNQPFLEGWALVDNPQDEDWQDVELSLVAGLPISFIHDLYSPRYVQRREVKVETQAVAGPVMMEAGMPASMDPFACAAYDPFAAGGADPFAAPATSATRSLVARRDTPDYRERVAGQVQTVTQSVGDLFEYKISHPVTVSRRQSALVPIVGKEFSGGRVVLYKRSEREDNPFAAVEFHNTTGLTLEGGPVMVFEGNTYAGEAMLDTLKPEEMRIIPFAVDLSVRVDSTSRYRDEEVHTIQGTSYLLRLTSARVQTWAYRFHNNSEVTKTCWLEHPTETASVLIDTPEPKETTSSAYRFRFDLPARQLTEFRVQLRRDQYHDVQYHDLRREYLVFYGQKGFFDDTQKAALEQVIALVERCNDIRREKEELEQTQRDVQEDQARLRANLAQLGATSDEARLRLRYVDKLEAQEAQLEDLDKLIHQLGERLRDSQQEVEAATKALDFLSAPKL